jgi:hypothetical protein
MLRKPPDPVDVVEIAGLSSNESRRIAEFELDFTMTIQPRLTNPVMRYPNIPNDSPVDTFPNLLPFGGARWKVEWMYLNGCI